MRRPTCLALLVPLGLLTGPAAWAEGAGDPAAPDKSGYTLFDPTPASAMRAFSADRPGKSNSPITVDAGHVQYETDLFSYTHANTGGVSTRLYTAFDPVLKVGLTNSVDLEVQFNGYNWSSTRDPSTGVRLGTANGAGDIVLRPKVNLFGNEGGVAAAVIPYVKFPTAARGIGNGHTEGGAILPISIPGPWGFTVVVQPEVDVLVNTADAGHHFTFTQILNISHPIGSKVTAAAEVFSSAGTDHRQPHMYTLDATLAYAVTGSMQLDVGAYFGLNRATPNLQLYSGVAQRF